ncbi:hypothetical protein ETD86_37390 [Nonomuraea turkmeniaca]|uniref:Helix-turn-helix domain-containing protein n=1 Tax=Nonomuraea turkmeniaca TaxID=103838 RepID=A0A5S4F4A7_9ACTN|nr:hypothetical protein [Nonomuraea turkmeniaca]TMR10993.1 hypothetical protein ETD86_37390 [Nonomuraea turkmeniaca]
MINQDALVDLVAQLAAAGRDDPTIAAQLELAPHEIRAIRRRNDIPAGETRWLGKPPAGEPAS